MKALGGGWTIDSVCRRCNNRVGTEVEGPFLRDDWLISKARAFHGIGNPRKGKRKAPPNPRHTARLADGTPIEVEMREGPWRARQRHPTVRRDRDKVTISAATREEGEAALETFLERLDRDGVSHGKVETVETEIENPEVQLRVEVNPTLWLRAMAKITLAAVSSVMPEAWLDSASATQLRGWLWDPKPTLADGTRAEARPRFVEGGLALICPPPQHLLVLKRTAGPQRGALLIVLFGTWVASLPVEGAGTPLPELAWRLEPIAGGVEQASFGEFLERTAVRIVHDQEQAEPSSAS